MSTTSFLLVITAAVLHAAWNVVVKSGTDRLVAARVEPLGLVSGLRETSTLFGLLFASRFLRERVTRRQTVAIAVAATGAVAIAIA